MRDHYELLGVPRDATTDQVRSAYRSALRKHHPDRFAIGTAEHGWASAVTRDLVAAWDSLGTDEARRAYDAELVARSHARLRAEARAAGPSTAVVAARAASAALADLWPADATTPGAGPAPVVRRVPQQRPPVVPHRSTTSPRRPEDVITMVLEHVADGMVTTGERSRDEVLRAVASLQSLALSAAPAAQAGLAPGRAPQVVAATCLVAAYRELLARGDRRHLLLGALASRSARSLGLDVPLHASGRPVPRAVPERTRTRASYGMLALAWLVSAFWVWDASRIVLSPTVTTGEWVTTVLATAVMVTLFAVPCWVLSRPGRPRPARLELQPESDVVDKLRHRLHRTVAGFSRPTTT